MGLFSKKKEVGNLICKKRTINAEPLINGVTVNIDDNTLISVRNKKDGSVVMKKVKDLDSKEFSELMGKVYAGCGCNCLKLQIGLKSKNKSQDKSL